MARRYEAMPPITLEQSKGYVARLHTARGLTEIRLRPDLAPLTVNSFVFLARDGYFDGSTFHRVVPGFVAQAGDPTGSGSGGPGYVIPDELSDASFTTGGVGMANAGPNTNGSQFFIVLADATHLDRRYTFFGDVIEGMDAVRLLTPRDPSKGGGQPHGDQIERVEIVEEGP